MTDASLWFAIAHNGRVKYTTDRDRARRWQESDEYRQVRPYWTAQAMRDIHIEEQFTHRLAIMLECALLDPISTWNDAHALLNEYRQALQERDEAAGIKHISPLGKD